MRTTIFCAAAVLPALLCAGTVTNTVSLFDLLRNGEVDYHLGPSSDVRDPPAEIFSLQDKLLHISGRGYGYMATKASFRDYHLVLEFKWGQKTWGKRAACARDNGILVHAHGPHGVMGNIWIASFEAQIIEGGMGDIIVIDGKDAQGVPVNSQLTSESELDRDGEKRWKKGASRQTVTGGRVNWALRDEDWKDVLGYRGTHDPDAPTGEWNRLEVIAQGDTLRYLVNGQLVNEAFDVTPCEGRVCIQTEAAEMIVRRFELWPLNRFDEPWPSR